MLPQQANSDLNGVDAPEIALGYAVAYPLGVVGCILALLALKIFMRINTQKEEEDAEHGLGHLQELTVRLSSPASGTPAVKKP